MRLYKVIKAFSASFRDSEAQRVFVEGQALFAGEPPVRVDGLVLFEQDNVEFLAPSRVLTESTELAVGEQERLNEC